MQASPWQSFTGHVQTGPSKWWYWGLAIFFSIGVFFTLFGVIINAIIPYDELLGSWEVEEPGLYPENGTSEEQDAWNATNEEWNTRMATTKLMEDLEEIKPLQMWTGIIGSMVTIVAIVMLIQLHPHAFNASYVAVIVTTATQLLVSIKSQNMLNEFYASFPEMGADSFWLSIQSGLQIGGTITCNIFLLLIVFMCSMKSQYKGDVEVSGFHIKPQISETEPDDIESQT